MTIKRGSANGTLAAQAKEVRRARYGARLSNNGAPGAGGMMTEVRVYPPGTLAPQTKPNQTYV